ncbi:MAG: pyruvate kinase [Planctomycetes bacterium]|nr:pyruvate kinase [Planctomycetota bacterium]
MRTRFICTIGPKTIDKDWLDRLHAAGMNIARVNGAHGSLDDVRAMVTRLKRDLPAGVEILLDLPGNKIRTDNIAEPILLEAGSEFVIKPDNLTYRPLYKSLKKGDQISAADGSIKLEVLGIEGENVRTKVQVGGYLATRKGVNVKGIHGEIPFDFERDIDLLNIAIEAEIDYVGLSFVRSIEHVRRIQSQLVGTDIKVVAKVETAEAVRQVDKILKGAAMIMIDRGDLEAEIGKEHVPLTQKMVLRKAAEIGVPVIIASQFLTSMLTKPLPFMAEVSDIANAVLDGANVLMLSEETAIGDYPEECIATMARVAGTVEESVARDYEVVILAAGPSTGFGSLTKNKHKCMLDVGGTTIINHQMDNFRLAGIPSEKVTIVTGHNTRQIEAYMNEEVFRGQFVYNPWYQTTNMAVSLWLAQKRDANLIICYGDIIFDPTILEDLIAMEGDVVLAVDNRSGDYDAEDEKVKLRKGLVKHCSKEIPDDEADGEFIGLAKISRRGARRLWHELGRLVRHEEKMTFLSDVFEQMAADGYQIRACKLDGRPWNDNDNLADLGESREKVYPRIRDNRNRVDTKVTR